MGYGLTLQRVLGMDFPPHLFNDNIQYLAIIIQADMNAFLLLLLQVDDEENG